ncbi:hypothetical protein [Melioribacter sp. OK-6-Me]|uniref:hypothetical protein n=1 Tax=unclassified Melioribacter TaxID=2627329 RepID=UPI003EDA34E1
MNKDNLTELISCAAQLNKDNTVTLSEYAIKQINDKKITEFFVTIFYDARKLAILEGYSEELFDRIQKTQGIPYSTVYDFLRTKGSLKKENFGKEFVWYEHGK